MIAIHERYEKQLENKTLTSKLTDLKRATDSFDALPQILNEINKFEFIETKIYLKEEKTGKNVCVSNEKTNNIDVLKNAQHRDYISMKSTISERLEKLKNQMKERNAPREERKQLKKIIKIIKNEKE